MRRAGKIIISKAHRLGHPVNRHLRLVELARDTALERHRATAQHRQESRLHRLVLHRVLQVRGQLDAGVQFAHRRALHRAYLDRMPGVADLHREGAVLDLAGDGEIHVGAGDVGSYRLAVVEPCRGGAGFPKRAVLDRAVDVERLALGHDHLAGKPGEPNERVPRNVGRRQTPALKRVPASLRDNRPTDDRNRNKTRRDDGPLPRRPGADCLLEIELQRLTGDLANRRLVKRGGENGRAFFLVGQLDDAEQPVAESPIPPLHQLGQGARVAFVEHPSREPPNHRGDRDANTGGEQAKPQPARAVP